MQRSPQPTEQLISIQQHGLIEQLSQLFSEFQTTQNPEMLAEKIQDLSSSYGVIIDLVLLEKIIARTNLIGDILTTVLTDLTIDPDSQKPCYRHELFNDVLKGQVEELLQNVYLSAEEQSEKLKNLHQLIQVLVELIARKHQPSLAQKIQDSCLYSSLAKITPYKNQAIAETPHPEYNDRPLSEELATSFNYDVLVQKILGLKSQRNGTNAEIEHKRWQIEKRCLVELERLNKLPQEDQQSAKHERYRKELLCYLQEMRLSEEQDQQRYLRLRRQTQAAQPASRSSAHSNPYSLNRPHSSSSTTSVQPAAHHSPLFFGSSQGQPAASNAPPHAPTRTAPPAPKIFTNPFKN